MMNTKTLVWLLGNDTVVPQRMADRFATRQFFGTGQAVSQFVRAGKFDDGRVMELAHEACKRWCLIPGGKR